MSKHLNPLEKEFLIRQYKSNPRIKLSDFCNANHVSDGAFKKWMKQYEEGGKAAIERYVKYYNEQRPCFAIGYDTPVNYRKRYFKGELPQKSTFADRVLTEEPKFVQKRRKQAHSGSVSTFEKENP